MKNLKIEAIAKHFDFDIDFVEDNFDIEDNTFSDASIAVLALTDFEADEYAREYIKNFLWAFKPSFLANETEFNELIFSTLQENLYEEANIVFKELIESSCGLEYFIDTVLDQDPRESFISSYDGNEIEVDIDGTAIYLYRM